MSKIPCVSLDVAFLEIGVGGISTPTRRPKLVEYFNPKA